MDSRGAPGQIARRQDVQDLLRARSTSGRSRQRRRRAVTPDETPNLFVNGKPLEPFAKESLRALVLAEQLANQANPKGTCEEKLEPALTFLANPWKLWETAHVVLRGTVLLLAFADRLTDDRHQGARACRVESNSHHRPNALCAANAASACGVNTRILSNATRFRTPEIALPFKGLEKFTDQKVCFGAQERCSAKRLPFDSNGLLQRVLLDV